MYNKKGWTYIKVNDVAELLRGITYKKNQASNIQEKGYKPVLRANNIYGGALNFDKLVYVPSDLIKNEQYIKKGDIIFAMSSGSKHLVGKSAPANFDIDGSYGAFCALLRVNPNIPAEYISLFFQGNDFRKLISNIAKGTNINNLKRNHILDFEIPFSPLSEQRAIVSKIEQLFSDLDNGIENFKKAQEQLKIYRQVVLKNACEGKLVPTEAELARSEGRDYEPADVLLVRILEERREKWDGKGKYKEPAELDTSGLAELPEGWKWINLGQITWSVKDGPHYSPKYVKEGIPFISGGNVRPNGIDFVNTKRITPELHSELSKRCKPEKGDILYTKGGTTGIARVNTYDFEFNVWVHVAVLKLTGSVEPFYIQHTLNSPFCYAQSQHFTHGVGNQDLGLTRMVNIIIGFPPLAEQHRIVTEIERRLSICDKMEETIAESLQKAESLRQSILKKAFEGKLLNEKELEEVRNAPDWEPAEKLLERIKAEKTNIKAKKKGEK